MLSDFEGLHCEVSAELRFWSAHLSVSYILTGYFLLLLYKND